MRKSVKNLEKHFRKLFQKLFFFIVNFWKQDLYFFLYKYQNKFPSLSVLITYHKTRIKFNNFDFEELEKLFKKLSKL